MYILKNCPACNSTKISGGVMIENGQYIQKIKCEKCGYSNHRWVGSAERH